MLKKIEFKKNKMGKWKIYWPWVAVLVVFLSMVTVVAPGRGAPFGSDDAFFLQLSWNAANGFGLDQLIPLTPHYLFHALLMKIGITEFLHFRYVNYTIILFSSGIFFLGLDKRRFRSHLVPLAICASLLGSLYTIQSPNSLALAFFLLGAGSYFFATDSNGHRKIMLLTLCGVLYALAGFMHAAVGISMIVLIIATLIIDRSVRNTPLVPCFILFSIFLWGIYAYFLGIDNLLTPTEGHDSSATYIHYRILLILRFYYEAIFAFGLVLIATLWLGRGMFSAAQSLLSIIVTLFYGATLIAYVVGAPQPDAVSGLHAINFLTALGQWIMRLPGAAFYLLLFTVFRWLGEGWFMPSPRPSLETPKIIFAGNGERVRPFLRSVADRTLAPFNASAKNLKFSTAVLGVCLLQSSTAVGSNTEIFQGMVFFAGTAIGITILLWHSLDQDSKPASIDYPRLLIVWLSMVGSLALYYGIKINTNLIHSLLIYAIPAVGLVVLMYTPIYKNIKNFLLIPIILSTAWLIFMTLFAFTYNHSTNQAILSPQRVVLQDSPLQGIRETPQYATFVNQLQQKYQQYGCSNLALISLEFLPLAYYILQHPTPGNLGVVHPGFYFPVNKIRKELSLGAGWCVLDITRPAQLKQDIDGRAELRAWVIENSDIKDRIFPPNNYVDDFRIYIRKKRQGF
jgi:hypothetical protein